MVKASLRTGTKSHHAVEPAIDVEATKVEQAPATASTAASESGDLTSIIPPAEGSQQEQSEAPQTTNAVARRPNVSVPTVYHSGEDEDGFDSSDDKYPTLRIVAGSGKLSQMFNVGSLILGTTIDESDALFGPPDPRGKEVKTLRFVPVALRKAWRENLSKEEQEEGQMPRIFKTRAEVEEAGGITQWIGRTPPTFKPTATCLMLIEEPEGCELPLFQLQLDGKNYCAAVYYASNSAYKAFAVTLHNAGKTMLQVPVLDGNGQPQKDARGFIVKRKFYPKYTWTYQVKQTVKKKDGQDFTVFVPEIRLQAKEETGPELRNYIESQLAPSSSTADAEE